MDYI
ncbi:8037e495-fe04-4e88-a9b4-6c57454a7d97 [Thermothielavioides terrestris]